MADASLRQIAILKMLPRSPESRSIREVHQRLKEVEGFNVTVKTVERDLISLEKLFALYCNDETKPFRWSIPKDRVIDLPGLSVEMALTLYILDRHSRSYLPKQLLDYLAPYFNQANHILDAAADNTLLHWRDKIHVVHDWLSFRAPCQDDLIAHTIYEGVIKEKQLAVTYQPRGKDSREYMLNPLGLVFRGQLIYVLCTAGKHETILHFLLNRFSLARLTEMDISPESRKVDLAAYIDQGAFGSFRSPAKIQLKVRIGRSKGQHLRETPLSDDQIIVDDRDDSFLLTATVADSHHLIWWLLSLGDKVEVLAPESIKETIISQIRNMVGIYKL
jgi:predicted DNA-binding transcriptional regulator YafY